MKIKNRFIVYFYAILWLMMLVIWLAFDRDDITFFLNANPNTEAFSNFIIAYTDTLYYAIGIVAIFALFSLFIKKMQPYRRALVITVFTYAVTYGLVAILKAAIGSTRPYEVYSEDIETFGKGESDHSMPSGHSAYSAAVSVPIAFKIANFIFIAILLIYNVFMMYTRLYLGMHWFEDVLVGSIIGVGLSIILTLIMDKLIEKDKMSKKVEIVIGLIGIAVTIVSATLSL